MMAFQFRLDAVLMVRRRRLDEQRRRVADCLRRIQHCVGAMEGLKRRECEAVAWARASRSAAAMDASLAVQELRWRLHLQRRMAQRGEQLDALERELTGERATLAERTKDVKALERLREKRAEEYRQNVDRREQAFLDDFAGQMATRAEGWGFSSAMVSD